MTHVLTPFCKFHSIRQQHFKYAAEKYLIPNWFKGWADMDFKSRITLRSPWQKVIAQFL